MERNRLNRWALGPLAVIALAFTACSSGTKALTEDGFITEMNSVCRTADRALTKLDSNDPAFVAHAVEIMSTSFDALSKLVPPKTLKADFDDFTANLDDQITQATKLSSATKSKDDAAAKKATGQLDKLSKDSDDLATSIGADKCVSVGGDGSSTSDTSGGTTADTSTANTPLPILTTPLDTAPLNSSGSGSGSTIAESLDGLIKAPVGYTWVKADPYDAKALYDDPVLGPNVVGYGFGKLKSDADGTLAEVYVIEVNAQWTAELTAAYLSYEGVADGVDVTTPRGLPARQKTAAFNGADAIVMNQGKVGVSVVTATGINGAAILDAVVYEQG